MVFHLTLNGLNEFFNVGYRNEFLNFATLNHYQSGSLLDAKGLSQFYILLGKHVVIADFCLFEQAWGR